MSETKAQGQQGLVKVYLIVFGKKIPIQIKCFLATIPSPWVYESEKFGEVHSYEHTKNVQGSKSVTENLGTEIFPNF